MSVYKNSYIPVQIPLFRKAPEGPYAVSIDILWNSYPVFGAPLKFVDVDIRNAIGTIQISQIGCLWIDNGNCDSTVIIDIPDTAQRIVAEPGSIRYYPVMSAVTRFRVSLITGGGLVPETRIIAINEFMPPSEDTGPWYQINGLPNVVVTNSTLFPTLAVSGSISFTVPQHIIVDSGLITAQPPDETSFFLAALLPNPAAAEVVTPIVLAGINVWVTSVDFIVSAANVTVATAIAFMRLKTAGGVVLKQQDTFLQIAAAPNPSTDKTILQVSGMSLKSTDGLSFGVGVAANGGGASAGGYSASINYHL